MHVEFFVLGSEFRIDSIPLNQAKFLLGREKDCHFRTSSSLVSRHHCVVKRDEYSVRIRDLNSRNGTFVNSRRIEGEVALMDGDVVQIGDITLQVTIKDGANLHHEVAEASLHDTRIGMAESDTALMKPAALQQRLDAETPPSPAPADTKESA